MRFAALVAALVFTALISTAAHATNTSGDGFVSSDGEFSVGITVTEPGSSTSQDIALHGSSPVIRYESIAQATNGGDLSGLCPAASGAVQLGGTAVGIWYLVIGRDNSGAIVSETRICVPLVTLGDLPPPPPLPVPPSVAEIWRSVQIPLPAVHVDPATRGVTGLTTNMWTAGPTTVPVAVRLRGYTVTGTARLVEYRFSTDEGPAGVSLDAGTAAIPAAHHLFETKGMHRIGVASVWEADVTLDGPGIAAAVPIALGSAALQAARDYPVTEVRSVLLP